MWGLFTLTSLVACLTIFLIVPVSVAMGPRTMPLEAWRGVALLGTACVAVTLLLTTVMYLPRVVRWPHREQILEVTPELVTAVRIDPWRRDRRQIPVSAILHVTRFHGQVIAHTGRQRYVLLDLLTPADAIRWSRTLREALGLKATGTLPA